MFPPPEVFDTVPLSGVLAANVVCAVVSVELEKVLARATFMSTRDSFSLSEPRPSVSALHSASALAALVACVYCRITQRQSAALDSGSLACTVYEYENALLAPFGVQVGV